jgi:GxxExxY protein
VCRPSRNIPYDGPRLAVPANGTVSAHPSPASHAPVVRLTVYDEDGAVLGEYFADLLVDRCLMVELKACRTIAEEHTAQLLGYLKSARLEHGVLVNFGSYRFQIRKYALRP